MAHLGICYLKHNNKYTPGSDKKDIEQKNDSKLVDKSAVQLRHYSSRPLSCNGDCGSQFARMINNIIHQQNAPLNITEEQIIAHEFWLPDSPLRQLLIKQIKNQAIVNTNANYTEMLRDLRDTNCFIKGTQWTKKIKLFFRTLYEERYSHILHTLSNQTCLFPDTRSMFGEYVAHQQRTKDRLRDELNTINEKLLNLNDNNYKSQQYQTYAKQRIELLKKIKNWKAKSLKDELSELQRYEIRLKDIKECEKYKFMKMRNLALTDTEIYAVMIYCEENGLCSKLRQSQRELNKFNVSCEWKTFFYHLCCAIYKIREIFHYKNALFEIQWIKQRRSFDGDKLYRGIADVHHIADRHSLHTISSFTHNASISNDFVAGNGMILAIAHAFRAIHNGRLMAADVSWLSGYPEGEFLVAPTVFHKVIQIDQNNPKYSMLITNWSKINVFEISDYESAPLKAVQYNVSARIQDPLFTLESLLPGRDRHMSQTIAVCLVAGAFGVLANCRTCRVRYRFCEHATSLLQGNIECPACRVLYTQYPHLNDNNLEAHELECYNIDCKKKYIKHTDLLQIEEKKKKHLGYKCRYCGKQQREALSERYTKHDTYLDSASEQYIKHMEAALAELRKDGVALHELNLMQDKKEFGELLRYIMSNERMEKKDVMNMFYKYPIVYKWIMALEGFGDGLKAWCNNKVKKQLNDVVNGVKSEQDMIKDVEKGANEIYDDALPMLRHTENMFHSVTQQQDVIRKEISQITQTFAQIQLGNLFGHK